MKRFGGTSVVPWLLQVLAMVGIGAVMYPSAADWFASRGHGSEISGYVQQVQELAPQQRSQELTTAHTYNQNIPLGVLRDPYSNSATQDPATTSSAYQNYLNTLNSDATDVMGELSYPERGIHLPIFHGTSDDVLSHGVGHLYGSSLPVGGESTHSFLTSHSGLVNASLFTPLLDAELDETFSVTVMGEKLHYRVDQITTVLPEQTESLTVEDGADHLTLITCTPLGINSHRLLVRGTRIPPPPETDDQTLIGAEQAAGFPWWLVIFVAASGAIAYLIFFPTKSQEQS